MRRSEKKLKTKWLRVLAANPYPGRIPDEQVEEFKRDVDRVKDSER